ncbi:uncharacterized protein LOC105262021 [Musca domestica]|uniref:Uncharacterized protein LOC105262021 n=1 Tax=Musca domestica TaxID=7370 RepID=A0A1I8NL63_MUSDO|nr:uncharacterized protein LOC105262021 [Musca domestica]
MAIETFPEVPSTPQKSTMAENPKVNSENPKPFKTKLLKKFKVKRMASILNNKFSKIMRRNSLTRSYNNLANELSLQPRSATQSALAKLFTLPRTRGRQIKKEHQVTMESARQEADELRSGRDFTKEDQIQKMETEDLNNSSASSCQGRPKRSKSLDQKTLEKLRTDLDNQMNSADKIRRSRSLYFKEDAQISSPSYSTHQAEQFHHEIMTRLQEIQQNSGFVRSSVRKSRKKRRAPGIPNSGLVSPRDSRNTSSTQMSSDSEAQPITETFTISTTNNSETPSSEVESTSGKNSETEDSMETKITSEESPIENGAQRGTPIKPQRKKKLRRSLSWRKDNSLVETRTLSSTDSETENKMQATRIALARPRPQGKFKSPNEEANHSQLQLRPAKGILNTSLNLKRLPISDQSLISSCSSSSAGRRQTNSRQISDSFDLGFETGSNEFDSPIRRKSKSQGILNRSLGKFEENQRCYSTPIKRQGSRNLSSAFNETGSVAQQSVSPIPISRSAKPPRHRSVYDTDSRRSSSIAMQVIREDHSWELDDKELSRSQSNANLMYNNASTREMEDTRRKEPMPESSRFWIKSGDFYVALEIFPNEAERLKLLYEIFRQRCPDNKPINFGIDGQKFGLRGKQEDTHISQRLPSSNQESSHYWFSTEDMTLPFSGKYLSPEKIQRLFAFLKVSVKETGELHFGIDDIEFSNVGSPIENWQNVSLTSTNPKYSLGSYSKSSRDSSISGRAPVMFRTSSRLSLPARSKTNWPVKFPPSQFDFESDDFREIDSPCSSISPFDSRSFDFTTLNSEDPATATTSATTMTRYSENALLDSFGQEYENEPLDQLFVKSKARRVEETDKSLTSIDNLMGILENQHRRLSTLQGRLSQYHSSPVTSYDALEALQESPEYLPLLKNIVADIRRIGKSNGFQHCSLDELERYMFFLSRYADVRLNACTHHMDRVMNVLRSQREVYV